jgi:hypothetical protein
VRIGRGDFFLNNTLCVNYYVTHSRKLVILQPRSIVHVKVVNLKHRALYVSCTSKKVSHVFDYGLNIFRSGMCTATQHISGLSDVSAYDRVSQYIDR